MKPKKKPAVVRMLVVVPRLEGLTAADHREAVRDALAHKHEFYARRVRVSAAPKDGVQGTFNEQQEQPNG